MISKPQRNKNAYHHMHEGTLHPIPPAHIPMLHKPMREREVTVPSIRLDDAQVPSFSLSLTHWCLLSPPSALLQAYPTAWRQTKNRTEDSRASEQTHASLRRMLGTVTSLSHTCFWMLTYKHEGTLQPTPLHLTRTHTVAQIQT
jgi:hypothetical protein